MRNMDTKNISIDTLKYTSPTCNMGNSLEAYI